MTWVRIDDRFAQHPKVVAAGPLAMAMQVAALGYCNRELTDGFIPRAIARTLVDCDPDAGITVSCSWVIERLIDAGMWDEVKGGYRIHDFHDYQPTKEQVLHERELTRKRVEAFRERNASSNGVTNDARNGGVTPSPVPVSHSRIPVDPIPEPEPHTKAPAAPVREVYPSEFEDFWSTYPRGHGDKKPTYAAWKLVPVTERGDVLAGLERWKTCERWQRGIILAADQFLKRGRWREPIPEAGARASPGNGKHNDPQGMFDLADRYEREGI